MARFTLVEQVHHTLDKHDPERVTFCVGSAAIAANLAEAGISYGPGQEIDAYFPDEFDVDTLCPQEYFDNLILTAKSMTGVSKFQLRWPKGRLQERGAVNQSIDIYPDTVAEAAGIVAFTACVDMGDLFYPIDYQSVVTHPNRLVTACGIRCLKLSEILHWIAIVGRQKDIQKVDTVLPPALTHGLITAEERDIILEECNISASASVPDRPYARLPITLHELLT